MKEYIERAVAIKRIKEYSLTAYDINLDNKEEFAGNSLPENYCEGLYEATELLDDLPAASVAEVRHGRWIAASDGDGVVCSECGIDFCTMIHETEKFRFCPNCGARIDKEDEHD